MSTHDAYAIVASGGKQYRVKPGQHCLVEKLAGEPGEKIELNQVLLIAQNGNVEVGAPYIANRTITAEIVEQLRGDKVNIFKMRRRKNSRRRQGHRQYLTKVKITNI